MRRWTVALLLAGVSAAAHAGDKVVYRPAPDWVKPAPPIDAAKVTDTSPALLLTDTQQRLKDGEVWSYADVARRVASAEMLSQVGTISLNWQPSKGDLMIHRVEIVRGGQHLDVLSGGKQFTVIRREQQLEKRQLDGELTATLAVEGLAVGDILHVTCSRTNTDPTLKGNLQAFEALPAVPAKIGFARARMIWPTSAPVKWKAFGSGAAPVATTAGGMQEIAVALPLPKQPEMPADAPLRFRAPPVLEATSFADWGAVSKLMAPLYATEGTITPGGALAGEVARIAAAETDPLRRTAAALALVQDKVRYLFNGMDTGNYVPQTPEQTWALRYGDCKAKTLLLLAILHGLGVIAEPVLANTAAGDLVPERLPAVAAFNHVLVRAEVAGETLWLDGTGNGTKLADIHDAPPFHYVLPIRMAGAALMSVPAKATARPIGDLTLAIDQSAGIALPAPMTATMTLRGPMAGMIRAAEASASKESFRKLVNGAVGIAVGGHALIGDRRVTYDPVAGTATITATGLMLPNWTRENDSWERKLDHVVSEIRFTPDRTRTAWAAIPAVVQGPGSSRYLTRITLPDGGKGFTLLGDQTLADTIAGVRVERKTSLANGVLTVDEGAFAPGGEIAPADIPAARQRLATARARLLEVDAPRNYPSRWGQVQAAKRAGGFAKQLAVYAQVIADEPDEAGPLLVRAQFQESIGDRRAAIADLDRAIAIKGEAASYAWRARLLADSGAPDKALDDLATARRLDPEQTGPVWQLALLELDQGRKDAALATAQERIDQGGKDKARMLSLKAELLGRSGDKDAALAAIDGALGEQPSDPQLLNSRCWLKGTLDVALDTALKDCTRAIELSDTTAPQALDSRAMVYFRMNRLDDALADLSASLDAAPDKPNSLYMRGVIRARQGKTAQARDDLAAARALAPRIDAEYKRYGIAAP